MYSNLDKYQEIFKSFLETSGIDLTNENFKETPLRIARFWSEFLRPDFPKIKTFPATSSSTIELNNYECWGMCPHHLLPVKYKVSIQYQPIDKVFGISKLPRIVNYVLKHMPLQEDLPSLIIEMITKFIEVQYIACQVEGMHLCMVMRGVKAHECTLTTSSEKFIALEMEDLKCIE